MNWQIVISIVTALGIFEIARRVLYYSFENSLIKKNLEIREIAERVLEWSSWLKMRNFEKSLPPEIAGRLYIDVFKVKEVNKRFSQDIMRLINIPQMNEFLARNLDQNMDLIQKNNKRLHDMTDKLNDECNKLRYKPLVDWAEFIQKIRKAIRQK